MKTQLENIVGLLHLACNCLQSFISKVMAVLTVDVTRVYLEYSGALEASK